MIKVTRASRFEPFFLKLSYPLPLLPPVHLLYSIEGQIPHESGCHPKYDESTIIRVLLVWHFLKTCQALTSYWARILYWTDLAANILWKADRGTALSISLSFTHFSRFCSNKKALLEVIWECCLQLVQYFLLALLELDLVIL